MYVHLFIYLQSLHVVGMVWKDEDEAIEGCCQFGAETAVAVIRQPENVRLSNIMNGTTNSTVTIEWTPPPNVGSVMYAVTVTPPPVSGDLSNTPSTSVTITVLYNINYVITVSVSSVCAQQQANATFPFTLVACEFPAGVSSNVNISISGQQRTLYYVGAMLMYHCRTGFYPQDVLTAVCGSNAMWSPDPAQHICTVDCGLPVFASNSNGVVGNVTNTTEGATVSFQCEEGLFLFSNSNSSSAVITCTNSSNMGLWIPNPTGLRCMSEDSTDSATTSSNSPTIDGSTTPRNAAGSTASADIGTTDADTSPVVYIVIGVVVAVLAVVCVVIFIVIGVCCMRHKRKNETDKRKNGMELQDVPLAGIEYNTLQSRGYKSDGDDEYSTVHHNPARKPNVDDSSMGTGYFEVRTDAVHKSNIQTVDGAEYSQLNTTNNPSAGLIYADVGTAPKKKGKEVSQFQHVHDDDKVTYSAIDTKATAARVQDKQASGVPECDLNMMLIQVKADVTPLWYEYGEVLGVPQDVLRELRGMEADNTDKLVEILDYWFRKFPRGAGPTWKEVALSLKEIGLNKLANELMKVDITGKLPIAVSDKVESIAVKEATPPPLPPKVNDAEEESLLPPKPKPRVGSLKQAPPRPPKSGSQKAAAPPRPPKSQQSQPLENVPARPPKPGY